MHPRLTVYRQRIIFDNYVNHPSDMSNNIDFMCKKLTI